MGKQTPLPGPLRLVPSFPFAGRSRELATLRALLPRAAGEGRRVALVSGEPGSGKSRLVRELAHDVAAEGALVLYGACDAVVPRRTARSSKRSSTSSRSSTPSALRTLGRGGELTRLLPELSSVVGRAAAAAAADADTERHRLHTAVTELLAAIGARARRCCSCSRTSTGPTLRRCSSSGISCARGADARMLLVATFRDVEADLPPGWQTRSPTSCGRRVSCACGSRASTRDELAEFVRLVTGAEADREVIRRDRRAD